MKALVLTGKKQLEIEDIKEPEIKPDEVLIHTAYAGICGTDKALYAGLPGSASAVPPIVLGHENSGVVTKVGSEVTNVKPGDRAGLNAQNYVNTLMLLVLPVTVVLKNTLLLLQRLFTQFLMMFH